MGAGGEASTFCVLSRSVLSISLRPHGQWPTRLICPWGFSRQEYWSGLPCHPPGDLPNRGIKHRCPALLVDSLPSELPRKPMNTEVGSLFLLQGNFLTQELNQGLLHCRQILYQLSYQGRPTFWWDSIQSLRVQVNFLVINLYFVLSLFFSLSSCETNSLWIPSSLDFPVSQLVKNPPAMQETWVRSLGWEDPLE